MPNLDHNKSIIFDSRRAQEGSAIVIVLLGIGLVIGGMSVWNNVRTAKKIEKNVEGIVMGTNSARWVGQLLHDDQFCAVTDFLKGLKDWETGELGQGKVLKETSSYVDLTAIDVPAWPGTPLNLDVVDGIPASNPIPPHPRKLKGKGISSGLVFVQPPASERKVLETKLSSGKKIFRIPVTVKYKGTIDGAAAFFDGGQDGYIEIDPDDPSKAVACYNAVSSRSTCLDKGGVFYPNRVDGPKCVYQKLFMR